MEREVKAPLVQALSEYRQAEYYPCHFPAHKGGRAWPEFWRRLVENDLGAIDLTELPGLDDLHAPQGPIARAQELTARLFGAGRSFFLVNGATVGLVAALLGLCRPGEPVLIPRHGHRSLVSAAVLSGIRPVFLEGRVDRQWGLPLGIDREELEAALARAPQARVLVAVYPTYEGAAYTLGPLVAFAHGHGIRVIVDEAHGAHFGRHRRFPPGALELGADVVVDGWHKTLGSLTQTAVLHLRPGLEEEEEERIALALDLLQTTSPSYPFLASIDAMRARLAQEGPELWDEPLAVADEVRHCLERTFGLEVWEPEPPVKQDPLRVVVSAYYQRGWSGRNLAAALRERGRLQVEAWGERHVLLIFSLADGGQTAGRVKAAFAAALQNPSAARESLPAPDRGPGSYRWPSGGVLALTPREAFLAPHRRLPLAAAAGKIAARPLVPYPPGIPFCWPGEVISNELVVWVQEWRSRGYSIQGVSREGEVMVVAG
ncbi:MAG: aminotransferase class I/II-fold pyridoxal phosphate-dependent enzyme [Moorellales bacterium]